MLSEISSQSTNYLRKDFHTLAKDAFNKHVSIKRKYCRANQGPFMNKNISKAIMTRSRLRNKFLKNKNALNKFLYNRQRNFCTSLIRKAKKAYFNSIETDNIVNAKKFLRTVKPFLTEKGNVSRKILLLKTAKEYQMIPL